MKITFLFREYNAHQISIEKLFSYIIPALENKGVVADTITNPYPFSFLSVFKAMLFFKKNQGEINHITGDIHWACLFLPADKTVLTVHDLVGLQQLSGLKKWIYYFLWVYLPIKKLKYITVISQKTKDEITSIIPSAAKKITVIENCLTIPVTTQVVKQFPARPTVLIVGTRSNKNIERILQAAVGLPVDLRIIGELSSQEIKFLRDNEIRYTNYSEVSDDFLVDSYKQSHILCFPSLYEGFGLPIIEAQAQNCIVITSNRSPMNDVAGEAAVVVDPENVNEIRNAIVKIIDNKELQHNLMTAGRENVKKFLPSQIAQQYIDLYKKMKN